MTPQSGDIFSNPEYLFRIWENERKTRDLNSTLMWENIKYFGGFISGLLVAQAALLSVVWNVDSPGIFSVFVLPIAIILISFLAKEDLNERIKRFHLIVTHLLKLEELLGIYDDNTPRSKSFKEDKSLFSKYQENLLPTPDSTDKFIKKQMKKQKNTYTSMSKMYGAMILFAIGLIIWGSILVVI